MTLKNLARSVVAFTMALMVVGCTTTTHNPNVVNFGIGDNVGHNIKQQFLSIASDVAWTITIEYLQPDDATDWCNLSKTSGEGNANVLMTFGENPLDEDRSLILVVEFPDEKVSLSFTQRAAGSQTTPTTHTNRSGWCELPAFEADNSRYYFSMNMLPSSNNMKRSFSILYDTQYYLPLWVAYPLCKGNYSGRASRNDTWGILDPNVPEEKQLYMKNSYNGSYDRGHMLPSASRRVSNSDESMTYYPTNMTPQLSGLNQKKWASIEGQVRGWANGCDTLYVVTGAVLQTVGGNETINYTFCKSDREKSVAIPNYYYKALLQLRQSGASKTYEAMAIWVKHQSASGVATADDVITIDQLEERIGIDLFPNLDVELQESIESRVNFNFWGM